MKAKGEAPKALRGRPTVPAKKRINTRFPGSLAAKIEYAAAIRGVGVAAFIQEAVAAQAEQVIEDESRWQLIRDQAAAVTALIASPPKANKKIRTPAEKRKWQPPTGAS